MSYSIINSKSLIITGAAKKISLRVSNTDKSVFANTISSVYTFQNMQQY